MNYITRFFLVITVLVTFNSCFEDSDDNLIAASEINDFVWKGMNLVYLYKSEIPDLANDRFSSLEEYTNYLNSFSTPESLFESLIFDRQNVDKFSVIIPNYVEFLQQQQGISLNNGADFLFYLEPGSQTNVFGVVRLVFDGSPADQAGLQRGQVFNAVDGIGLTVDNLNNLLNQNSYTLNLADYNDNGTPEVADDTIESNSQSVSLTKINFTRNPVVTTEVINLNGTNVGYLHYTGFNNNFETQLNQAFATFAGANVQHLVVDLRYNPGGVINTAARLGSMITGQFNGQVFSKLFYNEDLQSNNTDFNFTNTISGGATINSLNLSKVYVITSSRSASASELLINSLRPYIEVVQVGDVTSGKTQASITIFDSPDLSIDDVNPSHTYAMQPLVAISVNKDEVEVPPTGIVPDISIREVPNNLGVLGDVNEPLLAAVLSNIEGLGRSFPLFFETLKPVNYKTEDSKFNDKLLINQEDFSLKLQK
ncbi:peptidase S41 [Paucihalobacter ruber]|uniref:Peptidase S41 n=1 Tax=Paucihalobacter ruber TaxID=2567861 RepID=A0A506PIX4_9FLAO|nr:S41 family peptidase [Paucihalobacter ruber]TPV33773.1 peptidase S41 [Paucihalobacter ruber]